MSPSTMTNASRPNGSGITKLSQDGTVIRQRVEYATGVRRVWLKDAIKIAPGWTTWRGPNGPSGVMPSELPFF